MKNVNMNDISSIMNNPNFSSLLSNPDLMKGGIGEMMKNAGGMGEIMNKPEIQELLKNPEKIQAALKVGKFIINTLALPYTTYQYVKNNNTKTIIIVVVISIIIYVIKYGN